uniref:Uncharacterized protein n=1 Tax=Anopheles atroparvus TaxID=41427 RepID=A0A182J4I3_ANOAO
MIRDYIRCFNASCSACRHLLLQQRGGKDLAHDLRQLVEVHADERLAGGHGVRDDARLIPQAADEDDVCLDARRLANEGGIERPGRDAVAGEVGVAQHDHDRLVAVLARQLVHRALGRGERVVAAPAELRVRVHHLERLEAALGVARGRVLADEGYRDRLAAVAHHVVPDLALEAVERLHHHRGRLELPVEPTVVPVEAVHRAGHVDQQPEPLRLLLWRARLRLLLGPLLVDRPLARQALDQLGVVELAGRPVPLPLALAGPRLQRLERDAQLLHLPPDRLRVLLVHAVLVRAHADLAQLLLERAPVHLARRPLHLLRHAVLLRVRQLVHLVARVEPVRAPLAAQASRVAPASAAGPRIAAHVRLVVRVDAAVLRPGHLLAARAAHGQLQLALAAQGGHRLDALRVRAHRQTVLEQHRRHLVERLRRVAIVVEHVADQLRQRIVGEPLQVAHDRDHLARRVRIVQRAGVRHVAQLGERVHQLADGGGRHPRPVLPQQELLRLGRRIVHGVAGEQIAQGGEEIVAQKREAGPVREHDQPKVRMRRYEAGRGLHRRDRAGRANFAPVGQQHLAGLDERLEDAGDVDGRLVRLVHHQHVARPDRLHQRRVLVLDAPVAHRRLQRQRLDRRVAVQLDVLARPVHQLQQPVDDLVLAHALVAHQQQVLAEQEVLQQALHQPQVLRHVVEHDVRHLADGLGAVAGHTGAADAHRLVRQLHRHRLAIHCVARAPTVLQAAAHCRLEHAARHARHELAHEGGVHELGGRLPTGAAVLLQATRDPQQLARGKVAGERLLHVVGRGAQMVGELQDLLHRTVERAVQCVQHAPLLAFAQAAHLVEQKEAERFGADPRAARCGRARAAYPALVRLGQGNDAEARVDAQQPAGRQIDAGLLGRAQPIEALVRHQPPAVVQLQLAIVHQPVEEGQRAVVQPVHAVEYDRVPVQGGQQQRRVLPHGVPVEARRALLQQIARRHVLVEHHRFHALPTERGAQLLGQDRLAAALRPNQAHVAHRHRLQQVRQQAALVARGHVRLAFGRAGARLALREPKVDRRAVVRPAQLYLELALVRRGHADGAEFTARCHHLPADGERLHQAVHKRNALLLQERLVWIEPAEQLRLGQLTVVAQQQPGVAQVIDGKVGQRRRRRLDAEPERHQLREHLRAARAVRERFRLGQHLDVRQVGDVARLKAGP